MARVHVLVILLTFLIGITSCDSKENNEKEAISINILPFPNKVLKRGGSIDLSRTIWVVANVGDSLSSSLATYLVTKLRLITGEDALITDLYSTRKHNQSIKIELDNIKQVVDESYTLDITSSHIKIKSKSSRGIFYGVQTILQLLKSGANDSSFILPKIVIKDSPRFSTRGITIKQSQLNNFDTYELFNILGLLRINSVFVVQDVNKNLNVLDGAAENYVNLYSGRELPSDIQLVSFGATTNELKDIYNSEIMNGAPKGIVLDLTSTKKEDLLIKLAIFAELSWSDSSNHDFSRVNRLSQSLVNNK